MTAPAEGGPFKVVAASNGWFVSGPLFEYFHAHHDDAIVMANQLNSAFAAGEKKEREKWEKEYHRRAAHFPPGWGA